ncbi:signal peptide peptidase SppA [Aestuariibacter halophilus]|uniref:Signal peptide peptidase SppA n=1 Tax=Fluctibacter halophilus TaxID=226011 RepID=A0ABS8G4B9_9ALTE|nr:signal peptide peptidase SppA [Aestuariibacter halophilus]MCC2615410.1 signal peptide peptidase SppA [Aestuariibacter halophilus]
MASEKNWTKGLFIGLWTVLNFCRKVFFNIVFIVIVVGLVIVISSDNGKITVPSDSALVLDLHGELVIEERRVDPFEGFMQEAFGQKEEHPEVLLRDVVFAIENAQHDKRIKALVLDVQGLQRAGMDKLQQIAAALDTFKTSGKPVYAIGDVYTQSQYFLAAHADHVYLNPMGFMLMEGYGRYRMYFKSALEKLKATTHVFKVGTYKSAIEPFIRDDMSEPARQANQAWLDSLWGQYKQSVAQARGFAPENFDDTVDDFMAKFREADGDFAQYALDNGWVDALKTREQVRDELIALLGKDDSRRGYTNISYENYLHVIKPPFALGNDMQKVGIVVAKGEILDGEQKPGTIGGDSTARLLRKARMDNNVKAVVLYVDSPGGSAFASEVIRQEVAQLQAAGKPVVAAMSTYAASGGYWISASADKIIAAPTTITGSIGVFGMFMTFENSLAHLGIHTDGVGTTEFAGLGATRPLDDKVGQMIQLSVENVYDQFLELVSTARDIPKQDVDSIAQGRVWIGEKALELGLVDELGYLDDAVSAAAELANLEKYDTQYVEHSLSAQERFWQDVFGQASAMTGKVAFADSDQQLIKMINRVMSEFGVLQRLNDPRGTYVYCLECTF